MDRATSRLALNERPPAFEHQPALVLPSRDLACQTAREVLEVESGVMLITGDAGMGKTWIGRLLELELPVGRRMLTTEVAPSDRAETFVAKVAHRLGLDQFDRHAISDFIDDRRRNDERWSLVIEEAHFLTRELLEEVRVFFDHSHFASLVLIGQTPLARKFGLPAYAGVAARVSGFEHLPPIDADEAEILLNDSFPDREWSLDEIERLHRDAAGIPGVLLKIAQRAQRSAAGPREVVPVMPASSLPRPEIKVHPRSEPQPHLSSPLLGPDRPPIRVEDGLIEVGWSADLDDLPEDDDSEFAAQELDSVESALLDNSGNPPTKPTDPARSASPLDHHPEVWAEHGQEFAPLGPMFARNRTSEDRGV